MQGAWEMTEADKIWNAVVGVNSEMARLRSRAEKAEAVLRAIVEGRACANIQCSSIRTFAAQALTDVSP
jgi:hypothetical protein